MTAFTELVRGRLDSLYRSTVVAEHGRVAPCIGPALREHQPHCLHAHRLVFPGLRQMDLGTLAPGLEVRRFPDFEALLAGARDVRQYLYVEDCEGCQLGLVEGPLPRQFLRRLAALLKGEPDLADWRARPGFEQVEAARKALSLDGHSRRADRVPASGGDWRGESSPPRSPSTDRPRL